MESKLGTTELFVFVHNNTLIVFRKDVYTLSSKPLGYLKFVKLRHDGKSNNPVQWHLNKVFIFVFTFMRF